MRILLIHPEIPMTYWGFQYSLPFIHKEATLPPLGLVSVAALLPRSWELRLVDMNVAKLTDEALCWADAVLIGGMLIQSTSMLEVLERAKRLGRRTVVGGPACTTSPALFQSCSIQGEHMIRYTEENVLRRLAQALAQARSEARLDPTRSAQPTGVLGPLAAPS